MLGKLLDRFRQKGPSRPRSKAETEKRRRVLIVLLIVLAVVSSVSVVGYGYYDTSIRPWHQRIVKVNGTVIEMRAFVKTMRTWVLLYQMYYGSTISPSSELAQSVATSMEENELMRQGLKNEFGTVISEDAVDAELRGMLVSDNATDEEFNQQYDSFVTNLKSYGLSVRNFRELYLKPSLTSKELQKQIGDRDYPATDNFEHAQVQALLITGSDNATAVRNQWMGAADQDAEFQLLTADNATYKPVKEYAKTSADNTTIVWVAKGIESTAFDNYTFSVEVGSEIGQPFPGSEGSEDYWVIKVLARESKPLSESDRNTLISAVYSKWLEDAKNSEDNVIVNYLDKKGGTAKLAWAVDHATVSTS